MYQLKVTVDGFKPPIWRRLLISEDASFYELHSLIQDSFGWWDYHMHNFYRRAEENRFIYVEDTSNEFSGNLDSFRNDEYFDEHSTRLSELLNGEFSTISYMYDFGDSWSHSIKLEKADVKGEHSAVLGGKRVAPPEDSRGWIHDSEMLAGFDLSKPSKEAKKYLETWGNDEELVQEIVDLSKDFLESELNLIDIVITDPKERFEDSQM